MEYVIGDTVMDPMANNTEKTDIVRVLTVFKRKWTYHFWTVFFQVGLIYFLEELNKIYISWEMEIVFIFKISSIM